MTKLEQESAGIEVFAKIIGDATRIRMLQLLMEGRALTAKELAYGARVEPATATQHLRRLQDGGLLTVAAQGRQSGACLASIEQRPVPFHGLVDVVGDGADPRQVLAVGVHQQPEGARDRPAR